MQEKERKRTDDQWGRCTHCGHKLFRYIKRTAGKTGTTIEIKCHSCRKLATFEL